MPDQAALANVFFGARVGGLFGGGIDRVEEGFLDVHGLKHSICRTEIEAPGEIPPAEEPAASASALPRQRRHAMEWWRRLSGGRAILLVAVLVALVAALVLWANEKNPHDVPNPAATAAPQALVPSSSPPAGTPPAAGP